MSENTALTKQEENQPVQMTKGDVLRLITFAVDQVKEMTTFGTGGSNGAPRSLAELKIWGGIIKSAGMIPKQTGNNAENEDTLISRAIAKIVEGDSWGFNPFQSQSLFHFIPTSGTIAPDYKALSARILGSGKYTYEILEQTPLTCSIQAYRIQNGQRVALKPVETYTREDAVQAGIYSQDRADEKVLGKWPDGNPKVAKKGFPEAHPRDHLFSKCIRRVFNKHCADLFFLGSGVKTAEDYEEETVVAEMPEQLKSADPNDEPFFATPAVEETEAPPEAPEDEIDPLEELLDNVATGLENALTAKQAKDILDKFGLTFKTLATADEETLEAILFELNGIAADKGA